VPGQANNAYVFPGIALGIIASRTSRVTDEMFAVAASTLAAQVSDQALADGLLFPPLSAIRAVSVKIAAAVAGVAFERKLATVAPPRDMEAFIREQVFEPVYQSYV
jgi:malate dehydrogenase (oxaloacetate-decarboxylating)(NADP+)